MIIIHNECFVKFNSYGVFGVTRCNVMPSLENTWVFLNFQNQSAVGNLIQLIKQ